MALAVPAMPQPQQAAELPWVAEYLECFSASLIGEMDYSER
jgi:hypothetical protein